MDGGWLWVSGADQRAGYHVISEIAGKKSSAVREEMGGGGGRQWRKIVVNGFQVFEVLLILFW